jgi:hypothetical protein
MGLTGVVGARKSTSRVALAFELGMSAARPALPGGNSTGAARRIENVRQIQESFMMIALISN